MAKTTGATTATARHHRRLAMGTTSVLAMMTIVSPLFTSGAMAQSVDSAAPETVVVSASRITTAGFDAPTPTTVLSSKDLEQQAEPDVVNTLVELPSMNGFVTQQAVGSATTVSGSTLNLRNLGENRVLVLLDGQRMVGSQLDGSIDINQIPQQLLKRVDIVTGGASASWGSDAVSGVVNFVLDNQFTGFKANINGGMTTYGDDQTGQIQLAAGTDLLGGRAHIVVSGDFTYDAGVRNDGNRPWYTAEKVIPGSVAATKPGQPEDILSSHVYEDQLSPGGIITAGPLKGTFFGPGGTPEPFTYGADVNDPFMIGGTPVDLGTEYDLAAAYRRGNFYGRFTYNLSPNTTVYISGMYSAVDATVDTPAPFFTGSLTMQCSNPFLPAQVTAACGTNKITSFSFGTSNGDIPEGRVIDSRAMNRISIGGDGAFNMFGSQWTWDAYAEHSANYVLNRMTNVTLTPLYNAAINPVRAANGNITCSSAVAQAAGCLPLDIIGTGVADPLALNWAEGSGIQPWKQTFQRQEAGSVSFNGQPFSDWAGAVSIATGMEYREEAYDIPATDPYSVGNGGNPLLSASGNNWFAGNFQPGKGNYHVVEGFVETGVPLFDSKDWGQANLDLSAREEKYSTAGWFTTWKAGFTYETPLEGLRLRGMQSRDVRAPGLAELFSPVTTGTNTVVDDFAPNAGHTFSVANTTTGNIALKPERSTNNELGIVYQPEWFPGFNMSVDYWRLFIKDEISALTPQQTVDVCFSGNTAVCGDITRSPAGTLSAITTQVFNLSSVKTDGVDYEASYTASLDDLLPGGWQLLPGGQITLRALATNVSSYVTNPGIVGLPIADSVGQLQQQQSASWTPTWRILGTQSLNFSSWGLTLTERWTASGVINRSLIQCSAGSCPVPTVNNPTINNDMVPSTFYLDVGGHYALTSEMDSYFKIDNIANSAPTLAPVFNGRTNVNQDGATGELLGRRYEIGIRLRY